MSGVAHYSTLARPATRPGRSDYPTGLTACAGRDRGLLPGASAHPGTVKIAVSSARPPMHNFAYTWPSALSTVRTATTSRAAIARLDRPLAAILAISSSRGVRLTGSSSPVRAGVRAPSHVAASAAARAADAAALASATGLPVCARRRGRSFSREQVGSQRRERGRDPVQDRAVGGHQCRTWRMNSDARSPCTIAASSASRVATRAGAPSRATSCRAISSQPG